jgi:DUF4097 and DUF4098 domain-containing protein YvlB
MNTLVNAVRPRRILTLATALFLAVAGSAPAATRTVEHQGRMPADGRVEIENIAGSIKVVGWDQAEIRVTGTLGEDVKELEFSAGERSLVIVHYQEQHRSGGIHVKDVVKADEGADLTIQLPRGCRLAVDVVSADVDVADLNGAIAIDSVSGTVDVRGACRELAVQSVSGNVEIDGAGRQTEVSTVSGNLNVRCDDADLEVETVTGDARVDCVSLRSLSANTVNGSVTMSGRPAAGATIEAESINGNLTLNVPADVSAAFEITTFNGEIENAFGQKPERTDEYVPGQNLKFINGSGAAEIQMNSLNGRIVILKK